MLRLVDLLETDSKESQELDAKKNRKQGLYAEPNSIPSPTSPAQPSTLSTPPLSTTTTTTTTTMTSYNRPHLPTSFETPDHKRKISQTSFGTRSTETTPNKLVHAEAKVQSLQNTFVNTIIDKLWFGKIIIPWVQGRNMFLTYTEFSPS